MLIIIEKTSRHIWDWRMDTICWRLQG